MNEISSRPQSFRGDGKKSFHRPYNSTMTKLKEDGVLKSVQLGAKHCFYVGKLDYTALDSLAKDLGINATEDARKQTWWVNQSFSENGWQPGKDIETAIKNYKALNGEENRINIYGDVKLTFDFSKLNLLRDDQGNIKYPCGVLFFGDSRNIKDMMSGTISCTTEAVDTLANDRNAIYASMADIENVSIEGIFRTYGHCILFYVNNEIEKEQGKFYPEITTIEFDTFVARDIQQWGMIRKCSVNDANKTVVCENNLVDYVLTHAFAKNTTDINRDCIITAASDFIWCIGEDYKSYNLDNFDERKSSLDKDESSKSLSGFHKSYNRSWKNDWSDHKNDYNNRKPKPFHKKDNHIKTANEDVGSAEKSAPNKEVQTEPKLNDVDSAFDKAVSASEQTAATPNA